MGNEGKKNLEKLALVVVEGRDAGRVIAISRSPFRIGRLLDNELVLSDEQASRKHAEIIQNEKGVEVVDLGSRNGLFVNRIKTKRQELSPGDQIRIGSTILLFQADSVAREIVAESIPDSPSFAVNQGDEGQFSEVAEEPTAIRYVDDSNGNLSDDWIQTFNETVRLYGASLPPQALISQLVDILFQATTPDRAQIQCTLQKEEKLARSRKAGKKCQPVDLKTHWPAGNSNQAILGQAELPVEKGKEKRSFILAPLKVGGEIQGYIFVDRAPDQSPFSENYRRLIGSLSLLFGSVLERSNLLTESRRLQNQVALMEKYLTPDVTKMLASQGVTIEESALSVEEREVTVLFSDIEGFTPLSERLSAKELAALLNEYFQRMVDVITANGGEVNKFIGDAIMALFGAPKSHGNDAANAVGAAIDMVDTLKRFWEEIDDRKRFNIRVGINTGRVVAGNIGSEKKMEYTVLGDEVNIASRIEGISLPNGVTIGPRTAELVKDQFELESVPDVKVKGKTAAMEVFRVKGRKN